MKIIDTIRWCDRRMVNLIYLLEMVMGMVKVVEWVMEWITDAEWY
jgi:hypothetical protein